MASVQQAYNSVFSSALAAAVTGSHAFRQSALGQRMTAARSQEAELKNINKVLGAYAPGGEISATANERELQEIERLGEKGVQGTLNLASLTGDVERARKGLQTGSRLKEAVEGVRNKQAEAQQAEQMAASMTPSEVAEGAAAGALAEEIMAGLTRKYGGNI